MKRSFLLFLVLALTLDSVAGKGCKKYNRKLKKCLNNGWQTDNIGFKCRNQDSEVEMKGKRLKRCNKAFQGLLDASCGLWCKPVNGGWSDDGEWSECTETCGGGEQSRTNVCDNPAPQNGGEDCQGEAIETRSCNDFPCIGLGDGEKWVKPILKTPYDLVEEDTVTLLTTNIQPLRPITIYPDFPEYTDTYFFNWRLMADGKWQYVLKGCMWDSWSNVHYLENVPADEVKVWEIKRTDTSLVVKCNDVTVLDFHFQNDYMDYRSSCNNVWSRDMSGVKFNWSGGMYGSNGNLWIKQKTE